MSQSYCRRMYLISEDQYKEYYNLKSKNDEKLQIANESPETATTTTVPNASSIEETPTVPDITQNNVETGTGSNDVNLRKKFSDFIRNQNLQKHLEQQNWNYLYEKILPLLKTNV